MDRVGRVMKMKEDEGRERDGIFMIERGDCLKRRGKGLRRDEECMVRVGDGGRERDGIFMIERGDCLKRRGKGLRRDEECMCGLEMGEERGMESL